MSKFIIRGNKPLNGTVTVSGSKNAALPIICAALLTKEKSTLTNVPDIADVHSLITILEAFGIKISFQNNILEIDPTNIYTNGIPEKLIRRMRASILIIAPMLHRLGEINIDFPGGCVLGKRSVFAHTEAFSAFGAEILDDQQKLHLRLNNPHSTTLILPEQSVTATENAIMMASLIPGRSEIRMAAMEPHVQDLCHFLNAMGARITGIGTPTIQIEGVDQLRGCNYQITGDYLEAGTLAIAAVATAGSVRIEGIETAQLDSFWQKLRELGAIIQLEEHTAQVSRGSALLGGIKLRTAVYPSFATDLQAPFVVLLTQAQGVSKVFETLFEGRLNYLFELEKMGAHIELLNPHQALVIGPTKLKATPISSWDIRAGAAMVIAALIADGETEISNVNYIDRGYEKLEQKLRSLGADIQRLDSPES